MPAIEVSHLTKEYRLGALQSLKDTALNTGRRLLGRPVPERPMFKALDDVSFSIEPGEVVGIIGHNGAGKSTLLKMLARISTPTSGTVKVNGRIAPLIEVGAGFVPDFTGRENVYLNASILGMPKKEIDRRFDEIIDFAEMAEFIDTPVKRYSSGMQVKLAFAVATSIESEILIVDEVLAVGDLAFQRKCFDRMERLIKREGRTVLLVSHNLRQVARICKRCLLMDHGRLTADGPSKDVVDLFYSQSNSRILSSREALESTVASIKKSGEIDILDISITSHATNIANEATSGQPLTITLRLLVHHAIEKPEIVVGTHTTDFVYLTAGSTNEVGGIGNLDKGEHMIQYTIPNVPMVAGAYCVRLAIFDANGRQVLGGETLKTFRVIPPPGEAMRPPLRTLHVPTEWQLDGTDLTGQSNLNDAPSRLAALG